MRAIAHISDLHFGEADAAAVDALARDIQAARPNLVIVSGDLTKGARNSEFEEARAFFNRLSLPVFSVPGNHDVSPYSLFERFTQPFARYERWMQAESEPFYFDAEIAVTGLNSARSWGWHWNWAHGRLSRRQVMRAAERLASTPKLFKIVVLHHPVIEPPPGSAQRIVGRLPAALKVLDEVGTDLILAGHLHTGQTREIRISDDREILALQASTATSRRQRGEKNAYNRIVIEGARLNIEVRSFTGAAFEPVSHTEWLKDEAGWGMIPAT